MLSSSERKIIEDSLLTSSGDHTFKLEASGIARLYYGQGGSWKYSKIIGAATLISDYSADNGSTPVTSYIIIANPKDGSVLFTQELFEGFEYVTPKPFFHCFDSENGIAALSFAENSNPEKFADAVNAALSSSTTSSAPPAPHSKKPPRPTARAPAPTHKAPPQPPQARPATPPAVVEESTSPTPTGAAASSPATAKRKDEKKKKKGFLGGLFGRNKGDDDEAPEDFVISGPTGFRHASHIGWDPENGFDVKNLPPEWKKVFQEAGVKKSELSNPETSAVILQVIQEHTGGGLDAPPPSDAGFDESNPSAPPPPPLPSSGGAGAPPPPPPPPMPGAQTPYRDPSAAAAQKPAGAPAAAPDGRGDLLSQIRGGAQLRKVEIAEKPPTLESSQGQGLVGALRNAMNNRREHIREDEVEDDDEEDDIWSD